jgi:iron complex outermembrane receptor protein
LIQHTSQDLETEGVFEYAPTTGTTDQSQSFSPDRNNDNFGLTTLTVEGRVGGLDVVYTGGFLDRDMNSVIDYTAYSFGGGYQVYYITTGGYSTASEVFDLRKQYVDDTQSQRTSHELRFQGEIGDRFQFTVGAFLDDVETKSIGQFQYFGALDAGINSAVRPADLARGSNNRIGLAEATTFANDFTREEEQTAFFADVSFEVTEALTLSAGIRAYDIDFTLSGATGGSFGCKGQNPANLQNGDGVVPSGRATSYAITRADGTIGCSDNSGNNVYKT